MDESGPTCANCGYELTGLGQVGRCPECGSFYSRRTGEGIRHASADQLWVEWLLLRLRTVALGLAAVMVMICAGLVEWARQRAGSGAGSLWHSRAIWVGAFVAVVLVVAAITSYVYEKDEQ